jgi:hypothetical protein
MRAQDFDGDPGLDMHMFGEIHVGESTLSKETKQAVMAQLLAHTVSHGSASSGVARRYTHQQSMQNDSMMPLPRCPLNATLLFAALYLIFQEVASASALCEQHVPSAAPFFCMYAACSTLS